MTQRTSSQGHEVEVTRLEAIDTSTGEAEAEILVDGDNVGFIVKEVVDRGCSVRDYRASAYIVTLDSVSGATWSATFLVSDYGNNARRAGAAAKAYAKRYAAEVYEDEQRYYAAEAQAKVEAEEAEAQKQADWDKALAANERWDALTDEQRQELRDQVSYMVSGAEDNWHDTPAAEQPDLDAWYVLLVYEGSWSLYLDREVYSYETVEDEVQRQVRGTWYLGNESRGKAAIEEAVADAGYEAQQAVYEATEWSEQRAEVANLAASAAEQQVRDAAAAAIEPNTRYGETDWDKVGEAAEAELERQKQERTERQAEYEAEAV